MRRFFLFLFLAISLQAAPTVVTWSIAGPGNTPANGQAQIHLSAPCIWNGTYIMANTITSPIVAGAFSVSLVPNDACLVNGVGSLTYYTVTWSIAAGVNLQQTWFVPTGGPFTVPSVLASPAPQPTPLPTISLSQLAQTGATTGQGMCWLGSTWGPGACNQQSVTDLQVVPTVRVVTYSSSPNFDLSLATVQGITLMGDATLPMFTNATVGRKYFIEVCQDGTGNHQFLWPAGVSGAMAVGFLANKCSVQIFQGTSPTTLAAYAPGLTNF